MHQHAPAAGGHDWLATWSAMYDAERAQAEAIPMPGTPQPDFWAGQATRFAAAAQRSQQPDGFMRFVLPRLRPADTVLDIGAGSGRYEPLLAGAAAEVLALEPSPAMRGHLEQRIAEARLANVRVGASSWPSGDVAACDVALAAHVLYGVREIGPFLLAMNAVARRECYLLLALRHPSSVVSPFWQRLYGEPRLPLPGALECLNALYQLGIAAQLALVPTVNRFSYLDADEALADLRWRLRAPASPTADATLRAAIADLLRPDAEGRLAPHEQPGPTAVIWWETKEL
ncbi:MAG TPA: class I SAM-dependent methyltransferase [Kouleothrix sp.]|uniref:class I SAM-dependent methyltransferase n=1 Tax=Kouleothrix sp. TaxID=2779161 RepID=UPI002BF6AE37|nr:class I SAM-dependent methyltransferase [Kouleothrix sp.]HRC75177.1 class I SAM-dependent methyltransferase [Kouleothrix sp.]